MLAYSVSQLQSSFLKENNVGVMKTPIKSGTVICPIPSVMHPGFPEHLAYIFKDKGKDVNKGRGTKTG